MFVIPGGRFTVRGTLCPRRLFVKWTVYPRAVIKLHNSLRKASLHKIFPACIAPLPKCVIHALPTGLRNGLCCMWATWLLSLLNHEGTEGLMTIDSRWLSRRYSLHLEASAERPEETGRLIVARPMTRLLAVPSFFLHGPFRKSRWAE